MTPEQQAAYIIAQAACMHAEIEGMRAANLGRVINNDPLLYTEADYAGLPDKYGVHHNAVIAFFTGR